MYRMYYNQCMRFTERFTSVLLACSLFAGCTPQTKKTIQDGIYTGQGQGYGGVVSVNVTVEDQKITDVEVTEQNETRTVSDAALKLIPEAIVSSQSVSIDASSGATLTSHAILEAVEDALSKADTDISQWQKTESVSIRNPKKEISTDVAIIGGGIAGLSAALRLQQMGIDTTVIEKDSESGGVMKDITSAVQLTSSMYQPVVRQEEEQETDEEKPQEEKEEEKQENVKSLLDDLSPYFLNQDIADLFFSNLQGTLLWQQNDLGIPFEDEPIETKPYQEAVVSEYDSSANTVGQLLDKEAEVSGARLLYSTAAIGVEENGVGAVVKAKATDGTLYTISCMYAVIATGSYDQGDLSLITSEMNQGDGIGIGKQNGYETVDGQSVVMATGYRADENTVLDIYDDIQALLKYGGVIVNSDGQRFVDETADRQSLCNEILSQDGDCYVVLNKKGYESFRSRLLKEDIDSETKDRISSDEGNDMYFISSSAQLNDIVPLGKVIQEYADCIDSLHLDDGYMDAYGRSDFKGSLNVEDGIVLIRLSLYSIGNTGGLCVDENLHVIHDDGSASSMIFASGSVCGNVLSAQTAPGLRTAWAFVSGKAVSDQIGSVLAGDQLKKLLEKETIEK